MAKKLTRKDMLLIMAHSSVAKVTLQKAYLSEPMYAGTHERVVSAAKTLGLPLPPSLNAARKPGPKKKRRAA